MSPRSCYSSSPPRWSASSRPSWNRCILHFCSNVVLFAACDEFSSSFVHPLLRRRISPARDGALWRSRTDGCRSFVVHDLQLRSWACEGSSRSLFRNRVRRLVSVHPRFILNGTESHERERRSLAQVRALATTKIGRIRAPITGDERIAARRHSSFRQRSVSQQNQRRSSRPKSRNKSSSRNWHRRRKI